jgi:hypothetical protein
MTRKDIENKLGAIDDPDAKFAFQVPLLRGRQLVIENNQVGSDGSDRTFQFLNFAAPDKSRGIGALTALMDFPGDAGSRTDCQLAQLGHRLIGRKRTMLVVGGMDVRIDDRACGARAGRNPSRRLLAGIGDR